MYYRQRKYYQIKQVDPNNVPDSEYLEENTRALEEKIMTNYFLLGGNCNRVSFEMKIPADQIKEVVDRLLTKDDAVLTKYRQEAYKKVMDKQFMLTIQTQDVCLRKLNFLMKDEATLNSAKLSDIASALRANMQVLIAMQQTQGKNMDNQEVIVSEVKKLEDFE